MTRDELLQLMIDVAGAAHDETLKRYLNAEERRQRAKDGGALHQEKFAEEAAKDLAYVLGFSELALNALTLLQSKDTESGPYKAVKCPCGDAICKDWHVSGIAQVQGVKFSKEEANAVARLLNSRFKDTEQ